MNGRRVLRLGAKVVHDIASISLRRRAACLVINLTADRGSSAEFATARHLFAAIAQYVLIPLMAVVVVSGLIAMAATRWVKALLGISVFVATVWVVGSGSKQAELTVAASDPGVLDVMLRSERNMLWLLIALCVVNVFLAVWRPKMMITIR